MTEHASTIKSQQAKSGAKEGTEIICLLRISGKLLTLGFSCLHPQTLEQITEKPWGDAGKTVSWNFSWAAPFGTFKGQLHQVTSWLFRCLSQCFGVIQVLPYAGFYK